jgi:flagellum-specific peptidoglycan hydrolase FlgJ
MTPQQHDFLDRAFQAAKAANHIFPEMAACEAALESGYGHSPLAANDRNLFGMKQHQHPEYGTVSLPTREFLDGKWVALNSNWIVYPDWQSCFKDRMATLIRLAPCYPHYKSALTTQSATTYALQVSETWSTDPGWECVCGEIFQSQELAKEHATKQGHVISTILGLGRGEKVLAIYEAVAGDWNTT